MKGAFHLVSVSRIPIRLHWSFFLVPALIFIFTISKKDFTPSDIYLNILFFLLS